MLTLQYQKELLTLNMFPKNKQKFIQTKTEEIQE